jgi:hypothetical protein
LKKINYEAAGRKLGGKATEHVTRIKMLAKQTRKCDKFEISNRKHLTNN